MGIGRPARPVAAASAVPEPSARSYRTPQSTVDAFLHLARHDRGKLADWLDTHAQDAPELFKIWKTRT
jgi:hypothetical protein